MKSKTAIAMLLWCAIGFTGCSLTPEEKIGREQALKQTVDTFSEAVVQAKWDEAYKLSDGGFESSDKLKNLLTKSWVPDAVLTSGEIASMAWITDTIAKVKLTWTFQVGSVESYSSETFVWGWKGNAWKYLGRSLR